MSACKRCFRAVRTTVDTAARGIIANLTTNHASIVVDRQQLWHFSHFRRAPGSHPVA